MFGRYEVRAAIAIVEQHIGGKQPLLQQVAAACHIVGETAGLVPPGDLAVEMRAGTKLRARGAVARVRRARKNEELVQALAKRAVRGGLERRRRIDPVDKRGESLGGGDGLAINMGSGRRLLAVLVLVRLDPRSILPELAHGDGAAAKVFEGIQRHHLRRAHAAGLALLEQALGRHQRAETAEIILGHAIRNRPAIIVKEAVGECGISYNLPGQRRQIGARIITADFFEVSHEAAAPVRQLGFPAVDLHRTEDLARERAGILDQRRGGIGKLAIHGGGIQRIRLQSVARWRRPRGHLPG